MPVVIAAVALAGISYAVQSNQQKIAAQKQADAAGDAKKAQEKLLTEQQDADTARKKKEDSAAQNAFMKTASTRDRNFSGAALPGAVTDQSIGTVTPPGNPGKKLLGS